ncbi:hypothetical protein MHYP_G00341760 [Metynnis hypsauchen]
MQSEGPQNARQSLIFSFLSTRILVAVNGSSARLHTDPRHDAHSRMNDDVPSVCGVYAARLHFPPQRAWLRQLAYKTADSIFKLHNQDKRQKEARTKRRLASRKQLTNDGLVYENLHNVEFSSRSWIRSHSSRSITRACLTNRTDVCSTCETLERNIPGCIPQHFPLTFLTKRSSESHRRRNWGPYVTMNPKTISRRQKKTVGLTILGLIYDCSLSPTMPTKGPEPAAAAAAVVAAVVSDSEESCCGACAALAHCKEAGGMGSGPESDTGTPLH